ncbi:MAG: type II secretion system F family protein [Planctomycetaceae bacterium]|nr:type II secretion system F family protein [Planctomycetaceae bacterium]
MEIWQIIMFGSITLFLWAGISIFTNKPSRADERLDQLRDPNRSKNQKDGGASVLEKAAPALSKALQPKTELEQDKLKIKLANAGYTSPNASQIYLAIKFASLIGVLALTATFAYVRWGVGQDFWVTLGFAGAAGLFLPEMILSMAKNSRQTAIFRSLPDTLDLLVVCVEAGLGLDAAMRRVAEELEDTHPELCGEFHTANMQLQMGRGRREVLHDLGVRTGVDDMRALAGILIQADKFGSSIAQALRVQSDSMRVKRRQMAEEKAQQTAVKLIFPLVLFIFPGIFVVLVGPAAIMIMENLLQN